MTATRPVWVSPVKKSRNLLTANEVGTLYETLDRSLDRLRLETQPEVAIEIMRLITQGDAGLSEFARVIRSDAALSGRLLRLANSAFFAQRKPVTDVDRACVLLGLERLKAVALGFHLCRGSVGKADDDFSRRIWGQSVMRGCLACELARLSCPGLVSEAFVVGLMLDAGIPLMQQLLGDPYAKLIEKTETPSRHFQTEFTQLPFTHVDIISVLAERWKLPEMLAKPLSWHHTSPPEHQGNKKNEPVHRLHRLAYCVGAVRLDVYDAQPVNRADLAPEVERLLGLKVEDLTETAMRAANEYQATFQLFAEVADPAQNLEQLAGSAAAQLVNTFDDVLAASYFRETMSAPEQFIVGGMHLEIETVSECEAHAYLYDSSGQRVISYRFNPMTETPESLLGALGLDASPNEEVHQIEAYLRSTAA